MDGRNAARNGGAGVMRRGSGVAQAPRVGPGVRASPRSTPRRRPPPQRRGRVRWPPALRYTLPLVVLVFAGRAHEAVPGLGGLPLGNVAVVLAAAAIVLTGWSDRFGVPFKSPHVRYIYAFMALAALSAPFALWTGAAISAFTTMLKLWLLFILILTTVTHPEHLRTLAFAFVLSGAFLVSGYFLEGLGFSGLRERQTLAFDRNEVAAVAAMGVPFAVAWAATASRRRWIGYGFAGVLIAGIVLTGSRGGFLALLAVGGMFLVQSRVLSTSRKMAVVGLAVATVTVAGSDDFWSRIESIFVNPTEDYNFQSREGRIEIWKRGLGYVSERPVTGVGMGNFPVAEGDALQDLGYGVKWSTAHNAYILVAAELGVPALLVFVMLLVATYRAGGLAYRRLRRARDPPSRVLAALGQATQQSLVGFAVGAVFLSLSYSVAFVFIVAVGSSIALLTRAAIRRQVPAPSASR